MSRPFKSKIGVKVGILTAIRFVRMTEKREQLLEWKCECGGTKIAIKGRAVGHCGCLKQENLSRRNRTHGHTLKGTHSATYESWLAMRSRCNNRNAANFPNYGGSGIQICKRWNQFEKFLADMSERPDGKTLDRKRNDLGYFKSNCRWATPKEQARNRKDNKIISLNGEALPVCAWAEKLGITRAAIYLRLKAGWSEYDALMRPLRITKSTHNVSGQTVPLPDF